MKLNRFFRIRTRRNRHHFLIVFPSTVFSDRKRKIKFQKEKTIIIYRRRRRTGENEQKTQHE